MGTHASVGKIPTRAVELSPKGKNRKGEPEPPELPLCLRVGQKHFLGHKAKCFALAQGEGRGSVVLCAGSPYEMRIFGKNGAVGLLVKYIALP